MMPKGWLREDPAGVELFALSKAAYEKCLTLLPNDALWQYGYADLLWAHYQYGIFFAGKTDTENILEKTLTALQTTLALDPSNQLAKDLLLEISYQIPQAVQADGENFVLLGLTATPISPTPWVVESTPTFAPTVVYPLPTYSMGVNTPEPVSTPTPLCGSAFLIPALLGVALFVKRRK